LNDADPHEEGVKPLEVKGEDEASQKTAAVVNEFVKRSFEALKDHEVNIRRKQEGKPPANIILPRGAGVAPHLEPFKERYGFSGAAVIETGLIDGIARYLALEVVAVPEATGGYDTNVEAMGRAVAMALARHDFVICNFKATDLAGHDGDAAKKVECCEMMDRLVAALLAAMEAPLHVAITADHSTPVSFMDHTGDTVPLLIWGPNTRPDAVDRYGERPCAAGSIGRISGPSLMSLLTNLMGTQEKFGA